MDEKDGWDWPSSPAGKAGGGEIPAQPVDDDLVRDQPGEFGTGVAAPARSQRNQPLDRLSHPVLVARDPRGESPRHLAERHIVAWDIVGLAHCLLHVAADVTANEH